MTLQDTPAVQDGPALAAITCLAERAVYRNTYITVFDDDVRFPDGRDGRYVRVVQAGSLPGIVVLPLAGDHAGLVRVYRYPTGSWEWGFPRGLAHGDDPRVTASEELLDELGRRPVSLTALGTMTPDSGILASTVHLFAAGYDDRAAAPRDTAEVSAVTWIPVLELLTLIGDGQLGDGFTLSAVCRAICCGLIRMPGHA